MLKNKISFIKLEFLGHVLNEKGICPDPKKCEQESFSPLIASSLDIKSSTHEC